MEVAGFFTKWLKDVARINSESGAVPHVVPDVLTRPNAPRPPPPVGLTPR
jgi:alpha-L-rhamnosidase